MRWICDVTAAVWEWLYYHPGIGLTLILGALAYFPIRFVERKAYENERVEMSGRRKGTPGGFLLGLMESVLFFAAFSTGQQNFAGAWLAMKVGAKWQSFGLLKDVAVKDGLGGELNVRYRTFMVGVAANVVAGFMGVGLDKVLAG